MVLIDGKSQVQELQLAVVAVEQVSAGGAVLARAPHVLSQAVQGGALLGVALRVVAVRLSDVGLERLDPVDLVGLLQRTAYHGSLHRRAMHLRPDLAPVLEPVDGDGSASASELGSPWPSFFVLLQTPTGLAVKLASWLGSVKDSSAWALLTSRDSISWAQRARVARDFSQCVLRHCHRRQARGHATDCWGVGPVLSDRALAT